MVSNSKISAILVLSFITLAACETPLEIEDLNYQKRPIFLSLISPDQEIQVNLHEDRSILDPNYYYFQGIEEATIRLFEDGQLIGNLEAFRGDSSTIPGYYGISYLPQINKEYTFEVNHEDFPSITVSDRIPAKTHELKLISFVDSYEVREFTIADTLNVQSLNGEVEFTFEIFDKDAEKSFYLMSFSHRYEYQIDHYPEFADSIFTSGELFAGISQTGVFEENIDSWMLTDELFANSSHLIQMSGDIYIQGVVQGLVSHGIVITIRQVSEAYYQYYLTAGLQDYLSGDPFAEPVQVFTNVEGGAGILGSYIEEEFRIELNVPEP